MRFLCLHGRGTNSDIFETQLSALFSRISPLHTFDFVDAQFDCSAAPGISHLYPPPYLSWHSQYETQDIQEVHDFLVSIVEEDGPYDGVIGFSQGAALAASILLSSEYSRDDYGLTRGAAPLFKIAIFFNAVMLFSPSPDIGSNIGREIKMQEERLAGFLQGVDSSPSANHDVRSIYSEGDKSSFDLPPSIFGFIPETFPTRIAIPTLHVIGMNDQFSKHSQDLVKLCDPDKIQVLYVDGGHEIPRTEKALNRCSELFEKVVMMASLGGA